MRLRSIRNRRRGAAMIQYAFVLPILMIFVVGLIGGSLGVYYYVQVSALAREGARYAAVHGAQYASETGNPAATAQTIYTKGIIPMVAGLDTSRLNSAAFTSGSAVTWNTSNLPVVENTTATNPPGQGIRNTVSVTVSYTWYPISSYFKSVTISSTATMPMEY